jgi:hypothetical protein
LKNFIGDMGSLLKYYKKKVIRNFQFFKLVSLSKFKGRVILQQSTPCIYTARAIAP